MLDSGQATGLECVHWRGLFTTGLAHQWVVHGHSLQTKNMFGRQVGQDWLTCKLGRLWRRCRRQKDLAASQRFS